MPLWIAENAFLPFMTGLLIAAGLACFAFMLASRQLAIMAVIIGVCSVALMVVERYIVTDREQVQNLLYEVANDVEFNRHDAILANMKVDSRAYKMAIGEMPLYKFRTCNITGIREINLKPDVNPTTATINFVVYIDVNAMQTHQYDGPGRREITLTLEKQPDGKWLITDYSHRHPSGDAQL